MSTKTIEETFNREEIETALREHFKLPATADVEFLIEDVGDDGPDLQLTGATATYLAPKEK